MYNKKEVLQKVDILYNMWKNELFKAIKYRLIDIHTPLWLWSRNGFKEVK